MAAFGDHLEVITAMFAPGRGDLRGHARAVRGAINVPKGLQQPRIPIIVGGNGERVTAGYAIKYADELNFVFLDADEVVERMARRPRALRGGGSRSRHAPLLAVHARRGDARGGPGTGRPARRLAAIGLDRIVCFPTRWSPTAEAQAAFAEDCLAAGLEPGGDAGGTGALTSGAEPRRPIRRHGA